MIYFIQSGEFGPIKIGVTDKPIETRLAALQTGNPELLRVLITLDGDYVQEQELLERFRAYRIRGEWFSPSYELLSFIRQKTETMKKQSTLHQAYDRWTSTPGI